MYSIMQKDEKGILRGIGKARCPRFFLPKTQCVRMSFYVL